MASGLNRGLTGFGAQKLETHQSNLCILGRKAIHSCISIEASDVVLFIVLFTYPYQVLKAVPITQSLLHTSISGI